VDGGGGLGRPVQEVFRVINAETREPAEDSIERALRDKAVVAPANHSALVTKTGAEIPIEDSTRCSST
jgi:hypothetical protein